MSILSIDELINRARLSRDLVNASLMFTDNYDAKLFNLSTIHELVACRIAAAMHDIRGVTHKCTYVGWLDYPSANDAILTKIGGWPFLNKLDWPTDEKGLPLAFLAQIFVGNLLRDFGMDADLIQIFVREYDREIGSTLRLKSGTSYDLQVSTLELKPEVRVANSIQQCIEFDRNLYPTISEEVFAGILLETHESPISTDELDDLDSLRNLRTTKICPGYWGTSSYRFWGNKSDLFSEDEFPLLQFASRIPRTDFFETIKPVARLDPDWKDCKKQLEFVIGDGFYYMIYMDASGKLNATYLP
ncbi:MAG: DUF1963 domain-containing protein [Pirellula sp.]|nr:DUF1963 domain-containing protein [Pirellula sp.]